jgi:hypothetical protein
MDFPQELQEMFIDHLHDDAKALRATSLVCKAWLPPSRFHTFQTVKLASRELLVKWCQTFDTSADSPAHLVQNLVISRWFSPEEHVLSGLFRSFDNVQKLIIGHISFDAFDKPLESYFGYLASSVRSVELNWTIAQHPRDLMRFISIFPKLNDLTIMGVYDLPTDDYEGLEAWPASSPALRGRLRLSANTFTACRFLQSISGLPNGVHFNSLYLWMEKMDQFALADRLLQLCADTLESLEIGYEFFGKLLRV